MRRKKPRVALQGEGCQRQGGLSTLNEYLVRKVEREEAQIKDVPSLKRKSSLPSKPNGFLKGRKRGKRRKRSVCIWEGQEASVVQPAMGADRRGAGRVLDCSACMIPLLMSTWLRRTGTETTVHKNTYKQFTYGSRVKPAHTKGLV